MELQRKVIDTSLEKRIAIGLIVSSQYIKELLPLLNLNYLQNSYIRTISRWCLDYYDTYEKSPLNNIQQLYDTRKDGLKEGEAELISQVLDDISKQYENSDAFNVDYLLDQTTVYFKKRELEITAGNIQVLLDQGKINEAEEQVSSYKKVARITSNWVNIFDKKEYERVFKEREKVFFKLPGELGDFIGPFDREWLVGVSGAFKKGKTWLLQEFAICGILSKLKVAYFSLEMAQKKQEERIYKRLVGMGDLEEAIYPMFDCLHNQIGDCNKEERKNRFTVADEEGNIIPYTQDNPYRVCTFCRNSRENIQSYQKAVWYGTSRRPLFEYENAVPVLEALEKQMAKYFRIKFYPRFGANIVDLERDLDILEMTEGFVPDMVVTDYNDIFKPENAGTHGIDKEDETWMAHARLASTRKCLVVTGTQINKEGQEVALTKIKHTAKWVGKFAHVDVMMALNQLEAEKRAGIMRVNVLAHRHEDFFEEATVTLLQAIRFGQVHLDSQR
jgi:hypothetical protein